MVSFWIGWMVTLIILMSFVDYGVILPVALAMYGLGLFVSGGIIKFKLIMIGGIIAWGGSLAAFYSPYKYQLVVLFGVVILAYIIPGHLLKSKSKGE